MAVNLLEARWHHVVISEIESWQDVLHFLFNRIFSEAGPHVPVNCNRLLHTFLEFHSILVSALPVLCLHRLEDPLFLPEQSCS
jgi:hypothetical protein